MKKVFITGTAGFIGFHLAKFLLANGYKVHGYDGLTNYYDVKLKERRNELLIENRNFSHTIAMLEDQKIVFETVENFEPDIMIHLAAQAGVRYSIENPKAYIDANIIGTFNVLEAAKNQSVRHLLMASTSSVYGANSELPFFETEKTDTQLTLYAATKKANESMAHAYSNLWNLPITMFRFFTVYGPWGRPDLALYKFVSAMLAGRSIDIYNNGEMFRDFTYIDDLVTAIGLLIDANPKDPPDEKIEFDSLSPIAPFRVVNIGNSEKIKLLDFITAIEDILQLKAKKNYMPIQMGDVPATWANVELLKSLTGFTPKTNFKDGIREFIKWYRKYYDL